MLKTLLDERDLDCWPSLSHPAETFELMVRSLSQPLIFSGFRYKVDPNTGLLSLIQHLFDDDSYCSPIIKAKRETKDGMVTKRLLNGRSLGFLEFKQSAPTIQQMIFTFDNGKVFAEFLVHINQN